MIIRFKNDEAEKGPPGTPTFCDVDFSRRDIHLLKKAVTAMRNIGLGHAESNYAIDPDKVTYLVKKHTGQPFTTVEDGFEETSWEGNRVRIKKVGPHGDHYDYFNLSAECGEGKPVVFYGPPLSSLETARLAFVGKGVDSFKEAREFAQKVGAWDRLKDRLRYLATYANYRGHTSCLVGSDFAPYSFSFAVRVWEKNEWRQIVYGGLIYHGPGCPGDGSGPSYTVDLAQDRPEHDWGVHT